MNVKLISYSKPYENLEGVEDAKDLIAYCARVSNPSNQTNKKQQKSCYVILSKKNTGRLSRWLALAWR